MRRIVFALLTLLLLTPCRGASRNPVPKGVQTTVYQNGQVIRIYDRSVTEPVRIFVIANSWTQFTVAANCQGGYFEVVIEPMP